MGSVPGIVGRMSRDESSEPFPRIAWVDTIHHLNSRKRVDRPEDPDCLPMSDRTETRKKLYIETVGCQMNLLDSELVVGQAPERGLRADRRHQPGRHDPLQHLLGPAARRGQDLQCPGPDPAAQGAQARGLPSASWAAWRRRTRSRSSAGPRTWTSSSGPASSRKVSELLARAKEEDAPQMAVSLPRTAGTLRGGHRELRRVRPAPRAGDAAHAVPGVRPDHDGLRQVLHLLHRPLGPRPRAEPPARRDPRRGPAARRPGGQGDHAARPDRQQLQVPRGRRPDRPALRPPAPPPRASTASSGSSSSPTSPTT